jgi:ArsR family transcriptional regulator
MNASDILPFPSQNEPEACLQQLTQLFKASGDSLRLQLLRILKRDAFDVSELTLLFDIKQSSMSHHLKVLSQAGLIEPQREGNAIFYRRPLHGDTLFSNAIQRALFEIVDRIEPAAELTEKVHQIRKQRSLQSQLFFARNTQEFKTQQELIASYSQYAPAVLELLQTHTFTTDSIALEVGPGEGEFLVELSPLFESVIAVDNAPEMLQKARQTVEAANLSNILFIQGEPSDIQEKISPVDAIVVNMVLHHTPSPADIFTDCTNLLSEGGVMIVSDLGHHDQDWVKTNCGDLWLGFDPEELTLWAEQAGLEVVDSLYIGLRNGFQIQLHKFIKQMDDESSG